MSGCPTDEALAAFVDRRLLGSEHERVQEHVATCPTCLDVVAATLPASPEAAGHAASPPRGAAQGRSPRWRRWAVAAALVLVAGGALFAAMPAYFAARMSPRMAALASRWLGSAVHADAVSVAAGSRLGTFVVALGSVRIGRDPGLVFSAEQISATFAIAAPLFGNPAVSDVRLLGPTIELTEPKAGRVEWDKQDRERVLAFLAQTDRVEIAEARIVVRRASGRSFVIDHLNGGVERAVDGTRLVLQGRSESGNVDVVGSLSEDDVALLTIAGRDLDAATLPLLAPKVTGSADVRLDLTIAGDALHVDGRIAVRKGKWIGRGPARLLPLQRETRAALGTVDATLGGSDLTFDDARAAFTWRHGKWRLPRIFLSAGTTIVGGQARVGVDGKVTMHGTARLSPELVAGLEPHEPALASFRNENGGATVPFSVAGSVDTPRFALDRP